MEEHHLTGPEHRLERLIFFSDAVFAIAITLLVIELHAPHLGWHATTRDYVVALAELMPALFGFIVSFFVVGAFWTGHHRAFALASTWDERLIAPNLHVLFAIAALPFFTAFMSGNPSGRLPSLLYCLWLLLAGLLNVRLQRTVTAPPVVSPHAPPAAVENLRARGPAVTLGAATAAALVLLSPYPTMGLMGLATIGLWRRLLGRRLVKSLYD